MSHNNEPLVEGNVPNAFSGGSRARVTSSEVRAKLGGPPGRGEVWRGSRSGLLGVYRGSKSSYTHSHCLFSRVNLSPHFRAHAADECAWVWDA
eukprot:387302-Pyramimonas_sp.AAC.1